MGSVILPYNYVGGVIYAKLETGGMAWIGSVGKKEGDNITVLTVGVEDTREACVEWVKATIKLMRETGREDVQAQDKMDRLNS